MRILLTLFIIVVIAGAVGLIWLYNDDGMNVAINTTTPTPGRTSTPTSSPIPTGTVSSTRSPQVTPELTVSPTPAIGSGGGEEENFIRRGDLIINETGSTPNTWYLKYDFPGMPGITTKLIFPPDSACTINGGTSLCSDLNLDSELTSGARARVSGFFESNAVEITSLEILNDTGSPTPTPSISPTPTPTPATTLSPTVSPITSVINITEPASGTSVSGTMIVSASAPTNVARVDFYVDGTLKNMDSVSPFTYSWDTNNNGSHPCLGSHAHVLTARGYESSGTLVGESPMITVNMDNPAYCSTTPSPTIY